MNDTARIQVKETIGTGDPFDPIMLLPLIADWRVPRNCIVALRGEKCEAPLARLYVLVGPVEGHAVLGVCEKHHQEFAGTLTSAIAQLREAGEGLIETARLAASPRAELHQ